MSKTGGSSIARVLGPTLLGAVAFLVATLVAGMVQARLENYIVGLLLVGLLGGLLLGLFLWGRKMVAKLAIAGLVAAPLGFLGPFIVMEGLVGGIELLFPSAASYLGGSEVTAAVGVSLMGAFFGAAFGAIFGMIAYGRQSVALFSVAGGIASVPSGLLVGAMNSGMWMRAWLEGLLAAFGATDPNFLVIIVGFGVGAGLGIGLLDLRGAGTSEA